MYRTNSNGNQILRRFVQQAESYNRCMFPNHSSSSTRHQSSKQCDDHITEEILFCQNGIDHLNLSVENRDSAFTKPSHKEIRPSSNEVLIADVTSNGYQYETSSLELNVIQQCCMISIISPYAFTIQLTRDVGECDAFFKTMNDYYNSIGDLYIPREYLRKNLLCVTWDETASTWNRSQIMEYDLIDDTVNVFFVDYNSWEEHVPRSRLRFILTKYSIRPIYLLTCRLASIAPLNNVNQWNDVVSKTFQNVVDNCQCDVEPLYKGRDNTFYVNLFASHDEAYVCMNDFLIHCQMARPIDDISNEKNMVYRLDDDGQPMHSMIALYWKAGEAMRDTEIAAKKQHDDHPSSASIESFETKCSLSNTILTKAIMINTSDTMVFARYNSYIMMPWFTISNILNGLNEEKIKSLSNKFGFKPIMIDPLSHPLLCSQLLQLISTSSTSSQISLYSIDCVRKIFQIYHYEQADVYDLLDRARLAEASDDISFWEKSHEILQNKPTNGSLTSNKKNALTSSHPKPHSNNYPLDFYKLMIKLFTMWSNTHAYSNPIYDIMDQPNVSFSQPLMIDIQSTCSYSCTNTNQIPLLLLTNCFTSPPLNTHHNYVNQRIHESIEDEENLDPLYAKPRKRCVTLQDEPVIIPPKTSRFSVKSIKPQRAQVVSTTLPIATVLSTIESTDEIDQFIARENDRVERVKLRRRRQQHKPIAMIEQLEKPPPAFSNPNYIEIPILNDHQEKKLSKSILV